MLLAQNILWGFMLMVIGLTLPGMVNMTAVKVSMDYGFRAAFRFSLGAALALAIQAYLAITFARYLSEHPQVILYLKRAALAVFLALSLFFFYQGRKPSLPKNGKYSERQNTPFILGFILTGMNMLNIPYLFTTSTLLDNKGWISVDPPSKWLFIAGAVLGCWTLLIAYAKFASLITRRAKFVARHLNYFLSGLFMLLAMIQLIQLYY